MATLPQLSEEQIRTWTLEQKDRWWLANVWKGDMPQLTLRSAITGFILGGLLSATNLYVGAKTGWTLGVGITSVILSFAMFKVLGRVGFKEITLLENNCMQSIATAAGYMTAPMISSIGAYMLVTDQILPWWVIMTWIICVALLGVLFAFPMKRRFINDEQHPFPEGRACGVVMHTLHAAEGPESMLKVKALAYSGAAAILLKLAQAQGINEWIQHKLLGLKGNVLHFHENLDYYLYNTGLMKEPPIRGVPLTQLTIQPTLDVAMFGAGGLMGIRTGVSLMIGATINYFLLAPWMIEQGDIRGIVDSSGELTFGFRAITEWSLWGGVSMMVVASLLAFFAKPQLIIGAITSLFGRKQNGSDVLKKIELPISVFAIGIPIVGAVTVALAHYYFDVAIWLGIVAIPLVFLFTLIGAHSTALTSITPTGALGKLTQLTYGALAPGNIKTNLMTAGITGEASSNASNLLMDIKPGYMLGAKPRQQAIGHCIGILAGAIAAVPLFNILFLQNGVQNMQTADFPMPAVAIWKSVAEFLTQGLDKLPQSAILAVVIGAGAGLVLELIKLATKGKFPLSAVGIGLAFVIPWNTCLIMFLGAATFSLLERIYVKKGSWGRRVFVENQEPICAGIVAGAALTGILDAIVFAFLV